MLLDARGGRAGACASPILYSEAKGFQLHGTRFECRFSGVLENFDGKVAGLRADGNQRNGALWRGEGVTRRRDARADDRQVIRG